MITAHRLGGDQRPGIEMPRLRRVCVFVLSPLCGIGLALGLWSAAPDGWQSFKGHPYFSVVVIEVDGHARLSREAVLAAAGVHEGMSIWDASPVILRWRLQENPWIERARVKRTFPDRLAIRLLERRPMALVQLGTLTYVDRRGNLLGPLRDDDSRDFVIITGLTEAGVEFGQVGLHRALKLLRLCERLDGCAALSEARVDRKQGLTLFPMHSRVAVHLGWGRWRDKLERSARVLTAWEGQLERLAVVDVSFRDIAVVRLRDAKGSAQVPASRRGVRI
jgi:cell division protein FtsQ